MKKNKDGGEFPIDLEETRPRDLLSGALTCKREMTYRVPLVKTALSSVSLPEQQSDLSVR